MYIHTQTGCILILNFHLPLNFDKRYSVQDNAISPLPPIILKYAPSPPIKQDPGYNPDHIKHYTTRHRNSINR